MSKAERPFPPARDFDLSQSIRVKKHFDKNPEIPLPFRELVNFLKEQSKWEMDVGKTMVVLYENNQPDYGTAIRLSWFGAEERVSLDLIPRRTKTMDFARRTIDEPVPGQSTMYRVSRTAFSSDPNPFIVFESVNDSLKGTVRLTVTLDLADGSVSKEEKYTPKPN